MVRSKFRFGYVMQFASVTLVIFLIFLALTRYTIIVDGFTDKNSIIWYVYLVGMFLHFRFMSRSMEIIRLTKDEIHVRKLFGFEESLMFNDIDSLEMFHNVRSHGGLGARIRDPLPTLRLHVDEFIYDIPGDRYENYEEIHLWLKKYVKRH